MKITHRLRLSVVLVAGGITLTACDAAYVGASYYPYDDAFYWNDYYWRGGGDITINPPDNPDRPERPGRPENPIERPGGATTLPATRPPSVSPPIHTPSVSRPSRPSGGAARGGGGGGGRFR